MIEQNMFSPGAMPELARKVVRLAKEKSNQGAREEKTVWDELADVDRKIGNIV